MEEKECCHCLCLLTECFILVGSTMFGSTPNLVTRVGIFGTLKDSCLEINSSLSNCFSYRNVLEMASTLCPKWSLITLFLSKSSRF